MNVHWPSVGMGLMAPYVLMSLVLVSCHTPTQGEITTGGGLGIF